MKLWRTLSVVLLGLVLALSGGTMAISHGRMAGSTMLVICDEHGTRDILLDAQGHEIPASPHCPDCAPPLPLLLAEGCALHPLEQDWHWAEAASARQLPEHKQQIELRARAPPTI